MSVTVHVVREVDGQRIDYDRECAESELDGTLALEQNLPGHILAIDLSRPST